MVVKKKKKRTRAQKRQSRLTRAQIWLPTYNGMHVVRAYRKKFNVDTTCAVRELLEIGYEFKPGYVDNLLKAETLRREQLEKKKTKKEQAETFEKYGEWQNDTFCYIAGYTSGGVPYGVTWEEMGLKPYCQNKNDTNDDKDDLKENT